MSAETIIPQLSVLFFMEDKMKGKILILMVILSMVLCVQAFAGGKKESSSQRYLFEQNFVKNDVSEVVVEEWWGNSYSYIPNIGFSAGKRVIYNGSITLLDNIIPDSALAVLSKDELMLLRNTIYAKHGMIFQSNDLKTNFQKFSWYNPKNNNVEGRFSDIDKVNIKNIQTFENAQPNNNINKKDIILEGVEFFPVPDWSPAIYIKNDNIIEWIKGKEDNFKGSYRIENGFLVVLVTEQYVGTADYYLNSDWNWPKGVSYSNGIVKYNEPIKMVFPVGDIKISIGKDIKVSKGFIIEDISIILQKRQIGSVEWILHNKDYELANDLDLLMQKRAIELSKARQRNADFEEISLINSNIKMNDDFINIVNIYEVLMRGNIFGIVGHIVNVTVTGQINLRNNTIQVLEANIR
jgi:hypothetical protein